jgi:hypothetical protein
MNDGVVLVNCTVIKALEIFLCVPDKLKICHYDKGEPNSFPQECVTTFNIDISGKTWFTLQSF